MWTQRRQMILSADSSNSKHSVCFSASWTLTLQPGSLWNIDFDRLLGGSTIFPLTDGVHWTVGQAGTFGGAGARRCQCCTSFVWGGWLVGCTRQRQHHTEQEKDQTRSTSMSHDMKVPVRMHDVGANPGGIYLGLQSSVGNSNATVKPKLPNAFQGFLKKEISQEPDATLPFCVWIRRQTFYVQSMQSM